MTNNLKKKTLSFMEACWNDKNADIENLHKNFFSKDVKIFSPIENSIGIKSIQRINEIWLNAFPDINLKINKINSFDNLVVLNWECKGTHLREFNKLHPEGKTLNFHGMTCFYFLDGKVSEYWCYSNMVLLYQQLGFYLKRQEYEGQAIIFNDHEQLCIKIMSFRHKNGNFSRREVEVLSLWVFGFSAKGIASILLINYRTVQTVISNISYKCSCLNKSRLKDYVINIELLYLLKDLAFVIIEKLCERRN